MGGWSRCLTRPLILSLFVSVFCPAVLLSAQWVVSCTRITCIQPLSRCSLTFLAPSFFSESVVVVVFCCCFCCCCWLLLLFFCFVFVVGFPLFLFPFSFPPCVLSFLLAISYPHDSLPDWGSHFAFVFLSAFVHIPMLCDR